MISISLWLPALLNRWEVLQGDIMEKDAHLNQNYKQWHQFRLDLNNLNTWLDEAEVLLGTQEANAPAGDLEGMIRRHRVCIVFVCVFSLCRCHHYWGQTSRSLCRHDQKRFFSLNSVKAPFKFPAWYAGGSLYSSLWLDFRVFMQRTAVCSKNKGKFLIMKEVLL